MPSNEDQADTLSNDLMMVTVVDAARLLHISEDSVLRHIKDGSLHPVNVGRNGRARYRLTMSELSRFVVERSRADNDDDDLDDSA